MDSSNLRQRLHQLSVRAAQLEGARKADAARNEQLLHEVAQAKGRLSLGEEVSRIFDALQQRAHERSVGAFERLLSAVLNDVLPEEGSVRLLPQFKSNATWLDIALEKNGGLEDVLDGNGGAVTNVICAGLRFAALSRTDNRRLMILDEPDCWLKPERVPAFVRVIAQVATQTNTQTFFITHHSPDYFEGQVNLVRFTADAQGKVLANALTPTVTQWENDDQPGVRAIELINVRRHEHTLVPCFPGATAFIGDNNLGKSTAIATSFKAVAYGESDDSIVRRGADEARIVFHLEQGKRVEWSRSLKRSPSVVYQLWDQGKLVAEGRAKARNQAPEWVTEVLGVARVDDLDIQVGNQKTPVFLLNDSAPRRAQILSVGRESGHLKTLMKKYDEVKSSDRETAKQGELALARLKVRLGYLAKIIGLPERLALCAEQSEALFKEMESRERMDALMTRLASSKSAVERLDAEWRALEALPNCPVLTEDEPVRVRADLLQRLIRIAAVPLPPALPEVPVLEELAGVLQMGQRLSQATKALAACEPMPAVVPEMPLMHDLEGLSRLTAALAAQRTQMQELGKEQQSVEADLAKQSQELERIKNELGGDCPLCGAAFPEHGVEHHVH